MQTIILSESHDAKPFEEGSIIHETEFKKAQAWIDKQLEVARKAKQTKEVRKSEQVYSFENQAKTITILGSRGSGKTSFMKSLMELYKKKNVQLIELIDPTLIEEKGHPFLIILSELDKLVRSKLEQEDASRAKCGASREVCWEKALKKLAEGLPSLDPIGNNYTQWEDAEYVMEKGLRRVSSARTLAESFHKLLIEALEILKKDAFLIALDDIDIDFLKGWPVLETLRKYLQTPLLITLLSGDLRLYSKAIRKQQWKNFGKALLKNEAEVLNRISDYDTLVTDMEGQYLQKVLPSIYRIHLGSLQEKRQRPKGISDIKVVSEGLDSDVPIPIEQLYRHHLAERLGIHSSSLQEPYLTFLLGLPLRSQIRLLDILSNSQEKEAMPWIDVLLSELYVLGIDVDLIRSTPASLLMEMVLYLQRQQLLNRAYQFRPSLQRTSYDTGLFAFSATYAQHSHRAPYLFFEYLIRIGLPYHLNVEGLLPDYSIKGEVSKYFSFETLVDYALAQDQSLTESCGSVTAYLYSLITSKAGDFRAKLGVFTLLSFAHSLKKEKMNYRGRMDHEIQDLDPIRKNIAYLLVTYSREPSKQGNIPSASFYQLLAAIGELVKNYKLEMENSTDIDDSEKEKRISIWLKALSNWRTFLIPDLRNARAVQNRIEESLDSTESFSSTSVDNQPSGLLGLIANWLNSYPNKIAFPPHLVGRITSRLQRGLEEIPRHNVGEWMHRNVILFFNAVLIEATTETLPDVILNRNNAVGDDRIFRDNIQKFTKRDAIPLLAQWIFRCPLLLVFLDPKSTLEYADGSPIAEDVKEFSLFDDLSRVYNTINMRTGGDVTINSEELLQYLVQAGIKINTKEDLDKLAFVDWGSNGKSIRQDNFMNYYKDHLPAPQKNTDLDVAIEDNTNK